MAYVDLVSSGLTLVVGGGNYNFAYDTPVSADGSPHITMLGFQLLTTSGAGPTVTSTLGRLFKSVRIKIGANEVINFDDPFHDADGVTPGNLSVIAQKVGGVDTCVAYGTNQIIGELSLPFGLDATRSHRVNVSIELGIEADWCGQALVPATSELNMVHYYGTSTEATLYGSRQDFVLSTSSTRTIVVYGKKQWAMLGVFAINNSDDDEITEVRVNNGAFRALTIQQWRNIDGTAWKSPLRNINVGGGEAAPPQWLTARKGLLFLDLMRLTAGSNIDLAVTCSTGTTYSFMPCWVAPIGKGTGKAPSQTAKTVQSTTSSVVNE